MICVQSPSLETWVAVEDKFVEEKPSNSCFLKDIGRIPCYTKNMDFFSPSQAKCILSEMLGINSF